MKKDEFKVVAELYQFLATFSAKAISDATKLPNISDNLREALFALHAESNAPKGSRNASSAKGNGAGVSKPVKHSTLTNADPIEVLLDKKQFPTKQELVRLAKLLGIKINPSPKDSRTRVAKLIGKRIKSDKELMDLFSGLVSPSNETQTSGYFDLIRKGM